jgi:hypothetical protein
MSTRFLRGELLEARLCLAAESFGWDGPGLGGVELTYYIGPIPSNLDATDVTDTLQAALDVWASVADISFSQTNRSRQRNSIDLTFGRIDGDGGTLAEAYFPADVNRSRRAGDVLFDQDETWEIGNARRFRATDLMLVAVHEIGHALGLEHLDESASVMVDSVSPNEQFHGLSDSDIEAILKLYAAAPPAPGIRGDFNLDELVDLVDVDRLQGSIRSGDFDARFDLNTDGQIDLLDQDLLVREVLGTTHGDANLDGVFDTNDLVHVLQAGQFDDGLLGNSSWETGDWNADGEFNSLDIVLALQDGGWRWGGEIARV